MRYLAMKKTIGGKAITNLSVMARVYGKAWTGSHAATGNSGRLNPDFCRWLMGFPVAWEESAPTGTRSFRNSRRHSLERRETPQERKEDDVIHGK